MLLRRSISKGPKVHSTLELKAEYLFLHTVDVRVFQALSLGTEIAFHVAQYTTPLNAKRGSISGLPKRMRPTQKVVTDSAAILQNREDQ